jgi:hypothetical protein
LGDLEDSALTSQKLVEFAQCWMSKEGGGVQAQTVGNDLSHLGAVFSVTRPAWGYQVDPLAMPDASRVGMGARARSVIVGRRRRS